MTTISETGGCQVSWKTEPHGKIWVCNGPDAVAVATHARELTAFQERIEGDIDAAAAVAAIKQGFPETEQVPQYVPQGQQFAPQNNSHGAKMCAIHNLPREKKSGSKNGKSWSGWFCGAPKSANPCAVEWLD